MRIYALFLITVALCGQTFEVASIKVNSFGPSASQFPYLNKGRLSSGPGFSGDLLKCSAKSVTQRM